MEGAATEAEPEFQLTTCDPLNVLTGEMLTAPQCGRVSWSTLASGQTLPIAPPRSRPVLQGANRTCVLNNFIKPGCRLPSRGHEWKLQLAPHVEEGMGAPAGRVACSSNSQQMAMWGICMPPLCLLVTDRQGHWHTIHMLECDLRTMTFDAEGTHPEGANL